MNQGKLVTVVAIVALILIGISSIAFTVPQWEKAIVVRNNFV